MSTDLCIAASVVLACGVLFWLGTHWAGLLLGAVVSATALLQGLAADRMPDLGILIAAAALQGKPLQGKGLGGKPTISRHAVAGRGSVKSANLQVKAETLMTQSLDHPMGVSMSIEGREIHWSEQRRPRAKYQWREGAEAALLILPATLLLLVFMLGPTLSAFWLSFQRENLLGTQREWVGLANYAEMLRDPAFWRSVGATFLFAAIVVPVQLFLGLLAALMVARPFPGVALFRALFFLTTAVPTAVAAVAWGWFLHPVGGVANRWLEALGLPPQPWFTSVELALPTLAIVTAWAGVGFTAILLTAGLQQIPEELYEAARIDGAGLWVQFWRITLPLLSPTLFLVVLLTLLSSLTAFGQIHLLTRGGPVESTTVWVYRLYQDAFFNFRFTYAAAQAVALFLLLLLLAGLQFRWLGRKVHYE